MSKRAPPCAARCSRRAWRTSCCSMSRHCCWATARVRCCTCPRCRTWARAGTCACRTSACWARTCACACVRRAIDRCAIDPAGARAQNRRPVRRRGAQQFFPGVRCMLTAAEREQFHSQGYLIRDALSADDVARYVGGVERARAERGERGRMMNLQFLQPGKDVRAIQDVICHPALRAIAADLLGDGIVIDGASLFYADAGVDYRQGWHRDLMQVPDEQIDPHWFSDDYRYNYVQVNIPLTDDPCLWIVPGSHRRPYDEAERRIFGTDPRIAPVDAQPELANGIQLVLKPGQAMFYNNYAVHRGYAGVLARRRITIH